MDLIEKLIRGARKIPAPTDYYSGTSASISQLPREVLLFTRNSSAETLRHEPFSFHHRFALCICLETAGSVILDGRMLLLRPSDAIVIFPYQKHHFICFEEETICWLFITFELDNFETLERLRNSTRAVPARLLRMINSIVEGFLSTPDKEELQKEDIAPLLSLVLQSLLRVDMENGALTESAGDAPFHDLEIYEKVRQFVLDNIDSPLRVADVARHAAISESHLRFLFRRHFHVSLGQFILRTRIQRALDLLQHSELNITQIASQSGFGSLFSLSRAVRREVGTSPRQYRAKYKTSPKKSPGTKGSERITP